MYKSFREMPIWKEAMSIAEEIFKLSENLPRKEDYGLTAQIRDSALSISANIAEAFNFYFIARGSITETQSHLEYCRRVKYCDDESFGKLDNKLELLHKDLNKLILSLRH